MKTKVISTPNSSPNYFATFGYHLCLVIHISCICVGKYYIMVCLYASL